MIYNLRQQRSAGTAPTQTSVRSRSTGVSGIRNGAQESARGARVELNRLPMLEVEALELRQRLAEVTANCDGLRKEIDDLRRDRDHWRKLAEQNGPKPSDKGQKTWFCGRVSGGG